MREADMLWSRRRFLTRVGLATGPIVAGAAVSDEGDDIFDA